MKKTFLAVLVLVSFLALSAQALAAPIFSNNITVNFTAWYMPNSDHSFMVAITNGTDAGNITNITFQLGRPSGTLANYTNYTSGIFVKNNTNSVWHINFTQEQFGGVGTYNYTWFANTSTGGEWNGTQTIAFSGGLANSTNQVQLWLMNSTNNVANQNMTTSNIIYPAKTNATTYLIFSQSGTINLYLNDILSNAMNNTNITLASGLNKITGNTSGNENYSASSQTFWINTTYNTSFPSAFSINDTYINFNETVILNISFPSGASLNAEIQTPKSLINRTLWYNNSHYILLLNKTWLGDLQANISKFINITNIFISGNYTDNRNTTTLNFSYATTQMTGVSVSPSPVTNNTGQTASFTAYFNDTEGNALANAACNVTLGASQYVMNYLSGSYSAAAATAVYNDNIYNYNITCANNSYQTQENATEWLQIKYAAGGTSGGGGSGFGIVMSCGANEAYSDSKSACVSNITGIFTYPKNITLKSYAGQLVSGKIEIKNILNKSLVFSIYTIKSFDGSSEWMTFNFGQDSLAKFDNIELRGRTAEYSGSTAMYYDIRIPSNTTKTIYIFDIFIENRENGKYEKIPVVLEIVEKSDISAVLNALPMSVLDANFRLPKPIFGVEYIPIGRIFVFGSAFMIVGGLLSWYYRKTWKNEKRRGS